MKVVSVLQGTVAARVSAEEVAPTKAVPRPDLVAAIQNRYAFMAMGDMNMLTPVVFQHGRASLNEGNVAAFIQLQMMYAADIVSSADTEMADAILDDLFLFLDETFSYKISKSKQKRSYQSVIVVDFDGSTKNILSSLFFIERIVNKNVSPDRRLKRLSFALPEHDPGMLMQVPQSPLDAIENAEFIIERRIGTSHSDNRFFSTAPMRTAEHLAVLEEIEKCTAWSK